MSLMWSQMALAADMALDSFLALMTAAPRCCTVCGGGRGRGRGEGLNGGSPSVSPGLKREAASAHRDEVSFQPRLVLDGVVHAHLGAVDVDLGVVDVGVLGGGVVPPDDDVLHFVGGDAASDRHLQETDGHSRTIKGRTGRG